MLCSTWNVTSVESLSIAYVTKAQWDVWRLLPSPSWFPVVQRQVLMSFPWHFVLLLLCFRTMLLPLLIALALMSWLLVTDLLAMFLAGMMHLVFTEELQENSFWPLVPSSLTVLVTDGSNLALEANLKASFDSKTKFEPPVSNPGRLPVLWWMVLVLCWRQQLEQRLPWQRHAQPGRVRYQQKEATSVFVLVKFFSADVEHMSKSIYPSTTRRCWCLPSSAKVAWDCVASREWLQAGSVIAQICCTAYLASSWNTPLDGKLAFLSKHTWRLSRGLPAAAVAECCPLVWSTVLQCMACGSSVESFVWSLHGVSWSWRGHQETLCEVTQYLLQDTGISGPLKFLLVQSYMKSLLPNKKRISNQKRQGITKAKAEEGLRSPLSTVITIVQRAYPGQTHLHYGQTTTWNSSSFTASLDSFILRRRLFQTWGCIAMFCAEKTTEGRGQLCSRQDSLQAESF